MTEVVSPPRRGPPIGWTEPRGGACGLPRGYLDEQLVGILRCGLQLLQNALEVRIIALVDVVPDEGKLSPHLRRHAGGVGGRWSPDSCGLGAPPPPCHSLQVPQCSWA